MRELSFYALVLLAVAAVQAFAASPLFAAETRTLPVPNVTIYPGDTIGDAQLSERAFPAAAFTAAAVIDGRSQLVGKVARRTLLPGHAIPVNAVKELALVARNVPIRLVFAAGGLTITAFAAPLQDGSEGDVIRVRNVDSGAILYGTVQADGSVSVGAP
jgi:flagella basal body P-ring formation protein FlgA